MLGLGHPAGLNSIQLGAAGHLIVELQSGIPEQQFEATGQFVALIPDADQKALLLDQVSGRLERIRHL